MTHDEALASPLGRYLLKFCYCGSAVPGGAPSSDTCRIHYALAGMDPILKETNLQVDELKKALAHFTDDNRGHREHDGQGRCLEHGIISLPHVLPCPVLVAQRLVAEKRVGEIKCPHCEGGQICTDTVDCNKCGATGKLPGPCQCKKCAEKLICDVQINCHGGKCGKLLPCEDHREHEKGGCWCGGVHTIN